MSGIIGKGNLSYKKQNTESKLLTKGVKQVKFYHEAVGGETSIQFSSLSLPNDLLTSGLTNPSPTEILALNLKFYRDNLTVFSSLNGRLMDGLTYQVNSASLVFKNYIASANEIFEFTFSQGVKTGQNIVDARPLTSSGVLLANQTDYNVGETFRVNQDPGKQIGAVTVFKDGLQQFRTIDNTLNTEGNYIEVHATGGFGSIIRFKTTKTVDQAIMVNGTSGLVAEKPTISMMQTIETVQGQLDKVIPTVAALSGSPTTDFQTAPNNVDLKNFGDGQVTNTNNISGNINNISKIGTFKPEKLFSSNVIGVSGSTSAGVYTDSGLSLNLSVGRWEIESCASVFISGATGLGVQGVYGVLALTDSANVILSDINGSTIKAIGGFANVNMSTTLARITINTIIDVTVAGVHKIRFSSLINSGAPTVSSLQLYANSAYASSTLKATKIETIASRVGL